MPKMIQIRNVPDDVHRTLKSRAANEGMSLSDYVKNELRKSTQKMTMEEWLDRVSKRKPIRTGMAGAQIIREMRDAADRS